MEKIYPVTVSAKGAIDKYVQKFLDTQAALVNGDSAKYNPVSVEGLRYPHGHKRQSVKTKNAGMGWGSLEGEFTARFDDWNYAESFAFLVASNAALVRPRVIAHVEIKLPEARV